MLKSIASNRGANAWILLHTLETRTLTTAHTLKIPEPSQCVRDFQGPYTTAARFGFRNLARSTWFEKLY